MFTAQFRGLNILKSKLFMPGVLTQIRHYSSKISSYKIVGVGYCEC
jgi:hypothetical protein